MRGVPSVPHLYYSVNVVLVQPLRSEHGVKHARRLERSRDKLDERGIRSVLLSLLRPLRGTRADGGGAVEEGLQALAEAEEGAVGGILRKPGRIAHE